MHLEYAEEQAVSQFLLSILIGLGKYNSQPQEGIEGAKQYWATPSIMPSLLIKMLLVSF